MIKKKICIVGSGPIATIAADYISKNSNFNIEIIDIGFTKNNKHKISDSGFIPVKTDNGNAFMYKRADNKRFKWEYDAGINTGTDADTTGFLGSRESLLSE